MKKQETQKKSKVEESASKDGEIRYIRFTYSIGEILEIPVESFIYMHLSPVLERHKIGHHGNIEKIKYCYCARFYLKKASDEDEADFLENLRLGNSLYGISYVNAENKLLETIELPTPPVFDSDKNISFKSFYDEDGNLVIEVGN